MNFLKDVLNTHDEVEAVDLNEQHQCILEQINNVKKDVTKFLQEKYVEFEPISSEDEILFNKCKKLHRNIENLLNEISDETKKDIRCALDETKALKESVNETKIEINICDQLLEINLGLDTAEQHFYQKRYLEASQELTRLEKLIENPKHHVDKLEIFNTLKDRFSEIKVKLISEIKKILNNYLELIYPNEDRKCCGLKVLITNFDDFQIAFRISINMNLGLGPLNELATFLMNEVFNRVILESASIETVEHDTYVLMNVSVKNNDLQRPTDVIKNISNIFDFLENYLDIVLNDESISTISLIGNKIGDEFCTKLVESLLKNLVPSSQAEMEEFRPIKNEIIKLNDMLIENRFFHSKNNPVSEFIATVDSQYINKLCQNILKKADTIIKKDLHIMTEVQAIQADDTIEPEFPKCYVSNNVIELKNYISEIMDMVVGSSDDCAKRLIKTVETIFSLYYVVTPRHHKKMLETIPQQVALFYNNCMYLADYLLRIQSQYIPRLPENLKDTVTFTDVLLGLRTTGDEMFKQQLMTQKKQISDIIKDSGLSSLSVSSELDLSSEKSIRQCLRQLELLQTVWMNVLPREVYDKSLGFLLNAMVEELINKVLSAEDISAACATQLVEFFTIVKQRAPKVFSEPKEIFKQVKLWAKFNEIIFLLKANLADIDGRWADGKGPLAVEFRPEELKNIIRALFQNTDRRAALLNKIK